MLVKRIAACMHLSSTVYKLQRDIDRKLQLFPTPLHLTPPLGCSHWNSGKKFDDTPKMTITVLNNNSAEIRSEKPITYNFCFPHLNALLKISWQYLYQKSVKLAAVAFIVTSKNYIGITYYDLLCMGLKCTVYWSSQQQTAQRQYSIVGFNDTLQVISETILRVT